MQYEVTGQEKRDFWEGQDKYLPWLSPFCKRVSTPVQNQGQFQGSQQEGDS
jgi:hypothetical protein